MRVIALLALAGLAVAQVAPEQIHIALAGSDSEGNSNGIAFSWATPAATATSTVWYGLTADALTSTATGYSLTYFGTYQHHHVVVTGLSPATTYYYKVGDPTDGYSSVFSFKSAPTAATTAFSVAVFGDLGYGVLGNAVETRARLSAASASYDWIMHVGDISYADDYQKHPQYNGTFQFEAVWDSYQNWMQNLTAGMPYMVMPGNHEADCHSPLCLANASYRLPLSNFTAYNSRFRMPAEESGGTGLNMWYSYNYANVHFVSLDTETDYPDAPEFSSGSGIPCGGFAPVGAYLKWLEADLAAANANRKVRPFVIASGHRPIYSAGSANPDGSPNGDCLILQKAVEGLFEKYGVDVYFSGHVHSYQRTWPVYNNVVDKTYTNPKYPVHFIVGGAGCDEMVNKTLPDPAATPSWVASADDTYYGMGILDVVSNTELKFSWLESKSGRVLDTVTLVKSA